MDSIDSLAFGVTPFGLGGMNRLTLCQRAAIECGVAGSLSTTVGQSGSMGRIINWVDDAWRDLQTEHDDWNWMRSSNLLGTGASFQTLARQARYPLGTAAGTVGVDADNFGRWCRETFRCFTTSVGTLNETFLDEIPFDVWRNSYMLGAMRTVQTRPVAVAIGPDQSLNLGPPPNGLHTVTADYFVAPSEMVGDDDVPVGLPRRFRMLIVYGAMLKYAGYESAPEVMQRASVEYAKMLKQCEAVNMPEITWAGSL